MKHQKWNLLPLQQWWINLECLGKLIKKSSLARVALRHLDEKGLVKPVGDQSANFKLYTTAVEKVVKEVVAEKKVIEKGKGKKWNPLINFLFLQFYSKKF